MSLGYSKYLRVIYSIGDFLLLNAAFCGVSYYFKWPDLTADSNFLAQFLYINLFWVITTFFTKIHKIDRGLRYEQILVQLMRAYGLFSIFMIAFLYFLDSVLIPVFHFEIKLIVFGVVFLGWRSLMALTINFVRRRGLNFRKVIIVGNGQPALDMQHYFTMHPEVGYKLLGIFCDETDLLNPHEIKGSVLDAQSFAIEEKVDYIFCSLSGLKTDQLAELMKFSDRNLIRFKVVPDFRGFMHRRVKIDFYESVPVLSVRNEPLQNNGNQFLKRTFDICFSLLVIIIVFPFALFIFAPLIKLSSRGPIFFKQMRSGRNNEDFTCWKFRTMRLNNSADVEQARQGDSRITAIGSFLRKTSLDELPQFYNALIGNMSVVGPRPHMLKHTEEYGQLIDKFMVRHLVKPGITGWAQVNGYRGETRDHDLMVKRVEYDVWYLENWSILLDIKIVLITAFQIFSGKHQGG
jgi:Undecaprenyl-phosphate glucose phosphotransferase